MSSVAQDGVASSQDARMLTTAARAFLTASDAVAAWSVLIPGLTRLGGQGPCARVRYVAQ